MNIFQNYRPQNYTQEINKVALSAKDTKRYIIPDGINTLALGHYQIEEQHNRL